MKLGIMQPYFFPYLGYFSLIKYSDRWVVFDPVQFIRHGWIERNRILKPGEGRQYISVPLQKHKRETLIKDVKIRNEEDWKGKIIRQIEHYKKAPFFTQTKAILEQAFLLETDSITDLNVHALKCICEYLQIPLDYSIFSQMNIEIDPVNDAGEWALNISKALKADEYINPTGGIELFDKEKFRSAGVQLKFLSPKLPQYSQRRSMYEPGLSIIDVMMFNDVESINRMLDDFAFVES